MARPRKPTNVLEMSGAFAKNPQRARERAGEPRPTVGVGDPPEALSVAEKGAWGEIVATAHVGVLSSGDRIAVEIAARLLAEFRATPLSFPNSRLTRLHHLLGSFGMTPSDRSRVAAFGNSMASRSSRGANMFRASFERRYGKGAA